MAVEWKGVFPALLTPFTQSEELDIKQFERNLEAQVRAGVHGIIIGGSLGEASTLTENEKERLVRFSIEYLDGKIPVILNIAESSTRDALIQVQLAGNWGANGIMLLPPMRYKSDERETIHYFRTIARSTDLSIMIYNNPVDYKIDFYPALFEKLIDCENISALKESSRDVTNLTRMLNLYGERFRILCGVDTLAMEELCLGAHGWVAGLVCAFPDETVAIYNLVMQGEIKEATKIYRWFMPLLELDIHPKLVQYIKLAASETGLGTEYVRQPRLMLEGEEREQILKIIQDGIKNKPRLSF